jgi:hypothetical protein
LALSNGAPGRYRADIRPTSRAIEFIKLAVFFKLQEQIARGGYAPPIPLCKRGSILFQQRAEKWRKQEDLHSKPFGPFHLANESGALVRFNFQKCPRSDSHRDWIGFEPIFSALEYAGESGAPGRIRTDTLPGLSRFSLRWNTGAKDPPSGRAPDYSRYHGMRRFLRFGGIKWLPEEGSHRHRQIQSLSSY